MSGKTGVDMVKIGGQEIRLRFNAQVAQRFEKLAGHPFFGDGGEGFNTNRVTDVGAFLDACAIEDHKGGTAFPFGFGDPSRAPMIALLMGKRPSDSIPMERERFVLLKLKIEYAVIVGMGYPVPAEDMAKILELDKALNAPVAAAAGGAPGTGGTSDATAGPSAQ